MATTILWVCVGTQQTQTGVATADSTPMAVKGDEGVRVGLCSRVCEVWCGGTVARKGLLGRRNTTENKTEGAKRFCFRTQRRVLLLDTCGEHDSTAQVLMCVVVGKVYRV